MSGRNNYKLTASKINQVLIQWMLLKNVEQTLKANEKSLKVTSNYISKHEKGEKKREQKSMQKPQTTIDNSICPHPRQAIPSTPSHTCARHIAITLFRR